MTLGIVLVHGGGLDRRCWDLLLPQLATPAVAVDLPGRGDRPAGLRSVTLATCAEPVAAGAPAAGVDEVVVVGHSLGDDLDDAQVAWCPARLVPEAPGLLVEPVHLAPTRSASIARTWVRTGATSSCRRRRSRPAELAAVLDGIAAATAG